MNRIVLVLGGARSGKSEFAQKLGLEIYRYGGHNDRIAYLATGEGLDPEFRERIRIHRESRTPDFETIEESVDICGCLSRILGNHHVFILECLTTWLGNLFFRNENSQVDQLVQKTLDETRMIFHGDKKEQARSMSFFEKLSKSENKIRDFDVEKLLHPEKEDKTLIIVSNELGLGIVPSDPGSRLYRDIHGRMNKQAASISDCVYLVTAGIPARLA